MDQGTNKRALNTDSSISTKRVDNEENNVTSYQLVENQGRGDCGVYAVIHAIWGNASEKSVQEIREQISLIMKRFLELYQYNSRLDPEQPYEPKEIVELYKNIFCSFNGLDGFEIFKFVSTKKLSSPLENSDTNTETRNNLNRAIENLKTIANWDSLENNPETTIQIFKTCNMFDVPMKVFL